MTIPTDEEFLQFLYEHLHDKEWVELSARDSEESRREYFEILDRAGVDATYRKKAQDMMPEWDTPHKGFQGQFIEAIKRATLTIVKEHSAKVESIPVAMLPTRRLNGCAVKTPRGGCVILLDSGVVSHLDVLVRSLPPSQAGKPRLLIAEITREMTMPDQSLRWQPSAFQEILVISQIQPFRAGRPCSPIKMKRCPT